MKCERLPRRGAVQSPYGLPACVTGAEVFPSRGSEGGTWFLSGKGAGGTKGPREPAQRATAAKCFESNAIRASVKKFSPVVPKLIPSLSQVFSKRSSGLEREFAVHRELRPPAAAIGKEANSAACMRNSSAQPIDHAIFA